MKRIPRPLNATHLSIQYREDPTKDNKAKLRNNIIKAYINQLLYYPTTTNTNLRPKKESSKSLITNKKQENKTNKDTIGYTSIELVSINMLSIGLGLSVIKTSELIDKAIFKMAKKNMMNEGYMEMNIMATRVTQNWALKMAMERYPTMLSWATELQSVARINGYHPLQVKEATSAMSLEHNGLKTLFDMASKIIPQINTKVANQININGTIQSPQTLEKGMGLTTTMAIELLEEKGYTQKALDWDLLEAKHGLNEANVPNIKALPEDAQGTKSFDTKELEYLSHENRRAEELNIIPNIDAKPILSKKAKKARIPDTRTINIDVAKG